MLLFGCRYPPLFGASAAALMMTMMIPAINYDRSFAYLTACSHLPTNVADICRRHHKSVGDNYHRHKNVADKCRRRHEKTTSATYVGDIIANISLNCRSTFFDRRPIAASVTEVSHAHPPSKRSHWRVLIDRRPKKIVADKYLSANVTSR